MTPSAQLVSSVPQGEGRLGLCCPLSNRVRIPRLLLGIALRLTTIEAFGLFDLHGKLAFHIVTPLLYVGKLVPVKVEHEEANSR